MKHTGHAWLANFCSSLFETLRRRGRSVAATPAHNVSSVSLLMALCITAALVAGCGSPRKSTTVAGAPPYTGGGYYKDDGPGRNIPPNIEKIPDAVPRIEAHNPANFRPYTVLGQRFVPVGANTPLRQRGVASWYGRKFHGKKTANGETYDMYAMTAAHPTLPIPSYARVTRPKTGKSVVVRINDRGPFHSSRIIDLSYVAAAKLDLIAPGSGTVVVESITQEEIRSGSYGRGEIELAEAPAPKPAPAAPAPKPSLVITEKLEPTPDALAALSEEDIEVELDDSPSWSSDANDQQLIVQSSPAAASKPQAPSGQNRVYLQFGAFSARENAAALAQQLNRQIAQIEYRDAQVQMYNDLYRVQIGPYQNRTEAINAAYRIQQQTGLSPSVAVR